MYIITAHYTLMKSNCAVL